MKTITIDSSVIISALLRTEKKHHEAMKLWEDVLTGKCFSVMPYSVLVEVVAAIRRRTGSQELAQAVKRQLSEIKNAAFVEIDEKVAEGACEIAVKTGLKGMDAIVVQVATEFNAELVSFDNEMVEKVSSIL